MHALPQLSILCLALQQGLLVYFVSLALVLAPANEVRIVLSLHLDGLIFQMLCQSGHLSELHLQSLNFISLDLDCSHRFVNLGLQVCVVLLH